VALLYTKVQNLSKLKCYMSDTLIQTGHTIVSTCNRPRGGNANKYSRPLHLNIIWWPCKPYYHSKTYPQ